MQYLYDNYNIYIYMIFVPPFWFGTTSMRRRRTLTLWTSTLKPQPLPLLPTRSWRGLSAFNHTVVSWNARSLNIVNPAKRRLKFDQLFTIARHADIICLQELRGRGVLFERALGHLRNRFHFFMTFHGPMQGASVSWCRKPNILLQPISNSFRSSKDVSRE